VSVSVSQRTWTPGSGCVWDRPDAFAAQPLGDPAAGQQGPGEHGVRTAQQCPLPRRLGYLGPVTYRGRIPEPLIELGRRAVRGYGKVTAGIRPGPDFLLIGAKRGGSTSLYHMLLRHPRILPLFPSGRFVLKTTDTKGIHYFDSNYERGEAWYYSHFPTSLGRRRAAREAGGDIVVGEASPYYLFHPLAAERAARTVPAVRILLIVRDPVERAFSHYRERHREGAEELTFEEALEAETNRLIGEEERIKRNPRYKSYAHEQQSYRAQGEYAPALARWLQFFPRERLLVAAAEDFYANPQSVCDRIFGFLGLPPSPLGESARWNAAPSADLKPETRRRLVEHYAGFNAQLEKLLGQTFPSWTTPSGTPGQQS
jgi:hypothetical protein